MIVLLAGPDGTGKSTIADLLTEATTVTRREHFRPRKSDNAPVSSPHAMPARGLMASIVKISLLWTEQLSVLHARSHASKAGLVVIERGWWDQVVDPRRYRLDTRSIWLVKALGHLLPAADVGVLLMADPAAVHARKPELDEGQIAEQLEGWNVQLSRAAHRSIKITTDVDPDSSVSRLLGDLSC